MTDQKQRAAFEDALRANRYDSVTRLVYADWLEERGLDDEGAEQRRRATPAWIDADKWMHEFVKSINYAEYQKDENGNEIEDENGEPIVVGNGATEPHTYDDVLQAGHAAVSGEGYCFGTDAGADYFREGLQAREEFFRNWSVLTGVPVSEDIVADPPFRCAC